MSNVSEQLQNRILGSEKVVASARTHGSNIAKELAQQAIEVEGPATPATKNAFEAVIFSLGNGLEHSTNIMRLAEQAVAAEKADDGPVRQKRDDAMGELITLLTRIRSTIEDQLGAVGLTQYGLAGETSRVPRKVVEQVRNVVQLFEKTPVKLASPFGASFDSAIAVQVLTTKATALDGLMMDDDREARELEDAFAKRDRAVAAWSDVYQGTASALEGLFRRAGWKELAEKVRPTARKVRGEEAEAEGTEAPPENK